MSDSPEEDVDIELDQVLDELEKVVSKLKIYMQRVEDAKED